MAQAVLDEARGQTPAHAAHAYVRAMHSRFLKAYVSNTRMRAVSFKPWLFNRAAGAALRYDDFRETFVQICLGKDSPAQGLSPRMLPKMALA